MPAKNAQTQNDDRQRPSFLDQGAPRIALTKADAAYAEIRARILSCDISPGATIDQEMFATWLGSSTTPIREALRRLEAEQLVVLRAHSEVRVAPVSFQEFQEFHTIRLGLEPLAAALAAEHSSPELVATLRGLTDGTLTSVDGYHGSRGFHRVLYTAGKNRTLIQFLDSIWDRVGRYRVLLANMGSISASDSPEHVALVTAVETGNAAEAKRLMTKDIEESYENLLPNLKRALQEYE